MNKTKHTPGPWPTQECSNAGLIVCRGNHRNQIVPKEDAHLFSAAPDMLEALKSAEEWLSGWASAEPYIDVIQTAIAKAEGKA